MKQSDPRTAGNAPATKWGEGAQLASASWGPAVPGREMDVPGASSQTLTGEIGLSEFENVFAEVSICPGTMKLHQKSLRETHFEATVTRFEYSLGFRRKSKWGQPGLLGHLGQPGAFLTEIQRQSRDFPGSDPQNATRKATKPNAAPRRDL